MTDIIDRVTEALEAAVAERGEDYVYPTDNPEYYVNEQCRYQLASGAPACIVGAAARRIDPNIDMPEYDARTSSIIGRALGMDFENWDQESYSDPIDFPKRLKAALDAAQAEQDSGGTWGDALNAYRRKLGES